MLSLIIISLFYSPLISCRPILLSPYDKKHREVYSSYETINNYNPQAGEHASTFSLSLFLLLLRSWDFFPASKRLE